MGVNLDEMLYSGREREHQESTSKRKAGPQDGGWRYQHIVKISDPECSSLKERQEQNGEETQPTSVQTGPTRDPSQGEIERPDTNY